MWRPRGHHKGVHGFYCYSFMLYNITERRNGAISVTSDLKEPRDYEVECSVQNEDNDNNEVAETVEVNLDGELETDFSWNDDLADKTSNEYLEKKNSLETDLKTLLEADDDIKNVEMADCDFTELENSRRKRNINSKKTKANYSLRVLGTSLNAITVAATNAITSANYTSFSSLSANSAASYSQEASLSATNTTVSSVTETTPVATTAETTPATTRATTPATTPASTTGAPTTISFVSKTVSKGHFIVGNYSAATTATAFLLGAIFLF